MTVKVTKPAVNLRETLAELQKPSGVAGEAMLRAETPQEQFNLIGAGRNNLIINGDCRISQRGDFTTASGSTDETYYLDRFEQNHSGPIVTKQHITTNQPSEISNTKSWKLVATTGATGFFGTRQTIEDYKLFNGRAFTASAYIKTNNPSVRFYLYNGTSVVTSDAAIADGQWHRLEATFNLDASAGDRLAIEILAISSGGSSITVNTGDYIEFTGLQVELGKVATPFEHRSYGEELALCMRYYEVLDNKGFQAVGVVPATATSREAPINFLVTKRAVPTITIDDTTNSNVGFYRFSTLTRDNGSNAAGQISTSNFLHGSTGVTAGTVGEMVAVDNYIYIADAEL